ncbi:MAG TPA: hypothetical protein VFI05_06570 [Nitrospiraceae bacterium]|nr:hypothetical protein [Nitrospiraceae bacterium]
MNNRMARREFLKLAGAGILGPRRIAPHSFLAQSRQARKTC